jgi:hypothetical protein
MEIVKVFPVPVAPKRTWAGTPAFKLSVNRAIAAGWSPVG